MVRSEKMKKILVSLAILLLVIVSIITGCSKSTSTPTSTSTAVPTATSAAAPTSTETQKRGGTVTFLWRGASGSVGWPVECFGEIEQTLQLFFQGLVRTTVEGKHEPWLATSWEVAQDRMSVTFQLRKGVKFHDGTDFNAQAVKFNYDTIIEAGRASSWKSVDVLGDYTVRVNLTSWQNTVMDGFSNPTIVSPTAYNEHGLDWVRLHPVGTGPFIFDHYIPDVETKGLRNPNYWEAGKPYVDAFIIKYVPDWSARRNAMQAGEGDMTVGELGRETADMRAIGMTIRSMHEANFCLIPSGGNPGSPWADVRVRQAAEYAIDREAIAPALGDGEWKAPYQLAAPYTKGIYDPNFVGRRYNPEKAKELLKEAGYANGFSTTLYPFPGLNRDLAVAVQDYLGKVGIQVNIVYWDDAKYFELYGGGFFEGLVLDGINAYPNWNASLRLWFTNLGNVFVTKAVPPELLDAIMASLNSPDPDVSLMKKATDMVYDLCIMFPVSNCGMSYAEAPYVMDSGAMTLDFGFYFHPENLWLNK
jgi:peptide/nickel transport system substrate-binding protein